MKIGHLVILNAVQDIEDKVSSDRPGEAGNQSFNCFCGRVPWLYQYWPGWFMILLFFVQELPKAQTAVVLVLKRLRRRGNGLKSHPTDWEKPGIEPSTPGLQDIGLSATPRRLDPLTILSSVYRSIKCFFTCRLRAKKGPAPPPLLGNFAGLLHMLL